MKQYNLAIKIPNAIGEAIISTNLFRNLKRSIDGKLVVVSESINTQFLENLDYVDEIKGIEKGKNYQKGEKEIFIDVSDYQKGKDVNNALPEHRIRPTKHLSKYLIEEAEKQLEEILNESFKIENDNLGPEIILTDDEESFGYHEIQEIKEKYEKFVIGIHTLSSTENKNWSKEHWEEFISKNKDKFNFIEFLAPGQEPVSEDVFEGRYKLRDCASVIKACDAFIGVDSFAVHAAKAVNQNNVIALFGSSHPEVCSYKNFTNLFNNKDCKYQPCGKHGYDLGIGCTLDEKKEGRIYSCMYAIRPENLENTVKEIFR